MSCYKLRSDPDSVFVDKRCYKFPEPSASKICFGNANVPTYDKSGNIFIVFVQPAQAPNMNLQPVTIEAIPLGRPLPWRLYDRNGYILFARGEKVKSLEQLESLLGEGLLRDVDAPLQTHETGDWAEFIQSANVGIFPPNGIKPQPGEPVQIRLVNRNQQTYYSIVSYHTLGY